MADEKTNKPTTADKGPKITIKPPLIYLCALIAAFFLEMMIGLNFLPIFVQDLFSLVFILGGCGILLWAFKTFKEHGTNISVHKEAITLVTDGPYQYSRNPIYAGLSFVYLGFCFFFGLIWGFLIFFGVIAIMNTHIIDREEEYLETKFGDEYFAYKTRVRRWI